MTGPRVVITGMGVVVPHGDDVDTVYQRVIRGENECGRITRFDASTYACQIGSEVRYEVTAPEMIGPYTIHNEALKFVAGAADRAISAAGLEPAQGEAQDRRAIVLSTGVGPANIDFLGPIALRVHGLEEDPYKANLEDFYCQAPAEPEAQGLDEFHLDTAAPACAIQLGAAHVYNTASACASGSQAIADAAALIRRGESDVVLAGGVCTPVTRVLVPGFAMLQALSTRNDDPEHASRPFDKDRDGFVMGEGACVLLLEELEHARARGARIYAEFRGYGSTADAFHITQPKEDAVGPTRAMQIAMEDGGIDKESVEYVNAHGTSTYFNDLTETKAIHNAFGSHAEKLAVSSTKSMVGHLLGGSAAIEAAAVARSIRDGVIHPTINLIEPGEGCDLDYVPGETRPCEIRHAISNSLGFGGHNVCLAFSHPEA